MSRVLLTGGMGYIGSHTAVVLAEAGHEVVLYDNLCNSKVSVLDRLESIIGKRLAFIEGDVRDTDKVEGVLKTHKIDAVIHFAGLKAVGESVEKPIDYYDNNVTGTISLLKAMRAADVKTLVFSSSATVYGDPQYLPLDEAHPTSATNPYGRSKLQIEEILADIAKSDTIWSIACLRYFNPVGAHDSGLIGEDPSDVPNNLMPYIAQVAGGKLPKLNVFGDDYDTKDGTGVRDYIHVMDIAEGHKAALDFLEHETGWHAINLGTGTGYSVLEMVKVFEAASGQSVPYQIAPRRAGDISSCYAKANKAKQKLGWQAARTLEDMCASAWNFQRHVFQ
jgi:UDP-glucose 4-epimerase